jgi:dolichol-phosphate mannosyltransferase
VKRLIAAIIPCFRVKSAILEVIASIGPEVAAIYVVDDACPENTGKWVQSKTQDPRVKVLFHSRNQGVGAATMTGFLKAREEGATILVKLDGDGQMDASKIPVLVRPIEKGTADFTKGNRFFSPDFLTGMPAIRLAGNSALSFISKISTGYWRVMDPTNGFLAIHSQVFSVLPCEKMDPRYFFESDLLFRLNTVRAVVTDIPLPAKYGNEVSNLNVFSALLTFGPKHLRCFTKRIFYNYFLRDFNLGSVQGLAGSVLSVFGICFGAFRWWENSQLGIISSTGTVMLAALPLLVGIQLLLSAINYDILNEPRIPLQNQL